MFSFVSELDFDRKHWGVQEAKQASLFTENSITLLYI